MGLSIFSKAVPSSRRLETRKHHNGCLSGTIWTLSIVCPKRTNIQLQSTFHLALSDPYEQITIENYIFTKVVSSCMLFSIGNNAEIRSKHSTLAILLSRQRNAMSKTFCEAQSFLSNLLHYLTITEPLLLLAKLIMLIVATLSPRTHLVRKNYLFLH